MTLSQLLRAPACWEHLFSSIPELPPLVVREAYYSELSPELDVALATFGLGWHYDAGLQFVRLMLSGIIDLPELQIILGHWDEMLLFYVERLSAMGRVGNLAQPVSNYLKNDVYVTASGMFLPHYLERAASTVGKEKLLFSTDFPY